MALSALPPRKLCLRLIRSLIRMSSSMSRSREVTEESLSRNVEEPRVCRMEVREVVPVERRVVWDVVLSEAHFVGEGHSYRV
jgi:hypothetical protein